ncbi:hypothetical protein O1R50_04730 [Glycomyces luteolus]|uniref:Lipoprotein n=1 Tax=Glycomyces luteolus TaxID=2670330 RepID=A0A9X3P6C2_9ACTN|nr:hypothetical protein [Glycomyces luteolus]MDA1358914.1 hypothetical protein [Glycomyces luteolus]
MQRSRIAAALLVAPLLGAVIAGCGDEGTDGGADEPSPSGEPTLAEMPDASAFSTVIDNPFMPWIPGTVFTYEGGGETIVVEVTDETREVMGVTTVVVHDTVSEDGEVVEDTYDWYAQDADGNVWYFGEDSKEMSDGEITSTEGSWEAGVDGALPGIAMETDPQVGDYYYQEYYEGHAVDTGEVLARDEQVEVPYGSFDDCLRTEDVNPLDTSVIEHKFYAAGVGFVLETGVQGSDQRIELVSVDPTGSAPAPPLGTGPGPAAAAAGPGFSEEVKAW